MTPPTIIGFEYGVSWPADEFDDQPEPLTEWYPSLRDASEWMHERQCADAYLVRRTVGPTERYMGGDDV